MGWIRVTIAGLIAGGLVFLAAHFIIAQKIESDIRQNRTVLTQQVYERRAHMVAAVSHYTSLPHAVAALFIGSHELTQQEFQISGRFLASDYQGIRSIDVIQGSSITHTYPLSSRQAILGTQLSDLPPPFRQPAIRQLQSHQTLVIDGPVDSGNDQRVIVLYAPVILQEMEEQGNQTGIVLVTIDFKQFCRQAGAENWPSDVRFLLATGTEPGPYATVMYGDPATYQANPVVVPIQVGGLSWHLAVAPMNSWNNSTYLGDWLGATVTAIVCALLCGYIARYPYQLKRAVDTATNELQELSDRLEATVIQRTQELADRNQELSQALAESQDLHQQLTKSEEYYRTIFETTGTATVITNATDQIINANTCFRELLDRPIEEIKGTTWFKLVKPANSSGMSSTIETDLTHDHDRKTFVLTDATGHAHQLLLVMSAIPGADHSVLSFLDITEITRLEQEAVRLRRRSATRDLAFGLTHDFNNLLAVIIGQVELILHRSPNADTLQLKLNQILNTANEAAGLIGRFRMLSGGAPAHRQSTDLRILCREAVMATIPDLDKFEIVWNKQDIPDVMLAVDEMRRAVEQLLNNACEALPDGGTITITTSVVDTAESKEEIPRHLNHAKYVRLTISDNGNGMGSDTLTRAMNPYFSTKERSTKRGMGLGLPISLTTMQAHDGDLLLQSRIGQGTTATIFLPVT